MIKPRCPQCESFVGIRQTAKIDVFSMVTFSLDSENINVIRHMVNDYKTLDRTHKVKDISKFELICNNCGLTTLLNNCYISCDKCGNITKIKNAKSVSRSLLVCESCVDKLKILKNLDIFESNEPDDKVEEEINNAQEDLMTRLRDIGNVTSNISYQTWSERRESE